MPTVAVCMKYVWWSQDRQECTKTKAERLREVRVVMQRRKKGMLKRYWEGVSGSCAGSLGKLSL